MKTTIKSRQMKVLHYPFFSILLLSLVFIGCKKESPLPILETTVATSVYGTSATSGGTVITHKSAFLQESGVCWSTNNNPDINDFRASEGPSYLSIFVSVMDGLTPETEYYYRAYTISSEGVAYGNTLKLKTMSDNSSFLQTDSICFLTLRTVKAYAFLSYPSDLIERKGFCYSDQPMPTLSDTVVDYTQSPSYSGFYSLLTFDTGATLNVRAFIELRNGNVYYGKPLSVKPGKIEITAVDRLTFRSARITIENDPHPNTYCVVVTHPHYSFNLSFYGAGATTYYAYVSSLKPDTTYSVSAWLRYDFDYYGWNYEDYAGTVTFTTPPMPYIGNGTYEDPYTVDGAIYYKSFPEHVWVEGYIVGEYSSNSGTNFNPPFNMIDNILIAGDAEEIYRHNTVQINLPQGPIRDALNLKENPENKGAKLKIYGKVNVVSNAVAITEIQDFELD